MGFWGTSLILPEPYELAAGVKIEDIHEYYELISTSLVGGANGLIMKIPLRAANQVFSLYRIITLPSKVKEGTYAVYNFGYLFIDSTYNQRNYIRVTESDVQACKCRRISICPADTAILNTRILTCESQLYLQSVLRQQTCQRRVLVHYDTPVLVRYGSKWM
jgi:hypothetical protein